MFRKYIFISLLAIVFLGCNDSTKINAIETTEPKSITSEDKLFSENKDKVIISDIETSKLSEGFLGGVAIQGTIENTSKLAIYQILATVYGLKKTGEPMFEKTNIVLLPPEDGVLKPGYSYSFAFIIQSGTYPDNWSLDSKIDISYLAFTKETINQNFLHNSIQ